MSKQKVFNIDSNIALIDGSGTAEINLITCLMFNIAFIERVIAYVTRALELDYTERTPTLPSTISTRLQG